MVEAHAFKGASQRDCFWLRDYGGGREPGASPRSVCVTSQDPGPSPGVCLRRACTECCLLGMPACLLPSGESLTSLAVCCARVQATRSRGAHVPGYLWRLGITPPDWPSNSLARSGESFGTNEISENKAPRHHAASSLQTCRQQVADTCALLQGQVSRPQATPMTILGGWCLSRLALEWWGPGSRPFGAR
jgi:hypothetical protein